MHRWPSRLAGLALLTVSGGTTLLHRAMIEAAGPGPAQAAEFAVGLLTFVLASTGILLLIHGAKVFESDREPAPAERRHSRPADHHVVAEPVPPIREALDTRQGVALILARQAMAAAARRRATDAADTRHPSLDVRKR